MIEKEKNRLNYLDILRGIAIIMIVLSHMERGMVSAGINSGYVDFLDMLLYSIHLPLMFILSGITEGLFGKLEEGKVSYGKYLKKNIISLYVPYLIFIYFYWFVKMYIFSGNHEVSFNDLFHLFYNGKWVFWFLLSLLSVKIVHGFFEKNIKNQYICTISFVLIYIISLFTNIKIIYWLSYGLFYHIGYLISKRDILRKYQKFFIIGNLITLTIGLFLIGVVDDGIRMLLIGVPISILLFYLFYEKDCFKYIQICGKYSMVIYLCHTLLTASIRTIFLSLGIHNFTILLILGTIMATILSLLVVSIYQKIKIFRFIEYLFYPNEALNKMN